MDPNGETYVVAFHGNQDPISDEDVCPAISSSADAMAVAIYDEAQVSENRANPTPGESPAPSLNSTGRPIVASRAEVRRLTPLEKEWLQGFPDGYTDIPGASDTARGHALGNSMAVPVMRWIGERIEAVEAIAA